ncbi:hypothetical protein OAT67_08565, partial [Bacteriovoracaceae bacterium]|nr:hypothetical protein [Bacteriovoracaceae bacterium]
YNKGRYLAQDGEAAKTAYQVYGELLEGSMSYEAKALLVDGEAIEGMTGGVTWGSEKEASSALLTRVMSPPSSRVESMVSGLSEENRKIFLKDFLSNYVKDANGYRTYLDENGTKIDLAADVKDIEGNVKSIPIEELKAVDYENASLEVLEENFQKFIAATDDRPLSFIKPSVKMKLFKGQMPGQNGATLKPSGYGGYIDWKPLFGQAEKYIENAHAHGGGVGGGWEINFKALNTYGEHEEFVMWFRQSLKNAGKLFQAPGHQRMVFRRHPQMNKPKLAELFRAIQTLIAVDGIKGNTGIEKASWKNFHSDTTVEGLSTHRGIIRLEPSRWGSDNFGVEFRAGTKDLALARFYQTALAARVATNDYSGLTDIGEWKLYDGSRWTGEGLADRFGVEVDQAEKALTALREAGVKDQYMVCFMGWDDANNPIFKENKRKFVKSLTKDLILQLAESEDDQVTRSLFRTWTKSSRVSHELRNYIQPKRIAPTAIGEFMQFTPPSGRALVSNMTDVNNIDLGIEYSGKFPLMLDANYSPDKLADSKNAWLQTKVDMNPEERKAVIKSVAEDLLKELGGEGEATEIVDGGGHGHGLEVSYEIRDPQNRKWVVEWDGIGRSYKADGTIVEGSVRGGSIELVTPKFVPEEAEVEAVYKAFDKNNIMPVVNAGGGHVNIDLAAFEGKPKQLARFMSIFHENRGIISLMFQYANRLKSAEPIDISSSLSQKLKNFEGSEDDLKKLLYNEQYFNPRYGRKTRYNQLDMSAFFQDVIPEELITDDFDINSPTDPWRRTFRVDNKIRKAEFRLFNAPRDAYESALQIKLLRAMLSKALNEEDELSGAVQKVDHVAYKNNPAKATADLQKMCDQLGLDINDFRPALAEGMSDTDLLTRSKFFEPLEKKLANHPKQRGWGSAVEPRSNENPINSAGREWTPGAADELNTMTHEQRLAAAAEGERLRANIVPDRDFPGAFKRTDSCVDAAGVFLQ